MPTRMPASAVAEACDVTDEDLIRAERVTVRAATRWAGDPLPVRGLHQIAQHGNSLRIALLLLRLLTGFPAFLDGLAMLPSAKC